MKRFALLVLAAILLAPASARGQVTYPLVQVFVAVDAVEMDSRVAITGILQGEAEPITVTYNLYYSSTYPFREECQRLALLAMARPGQYLFQVRQASSGAIPVCKLTRAIP